MMTNGFRLVMTQGPQPGQTFTLEKDLSNIGRDPSNDIAINHPQISRQHARLTRSGNAIVLQDLGSTNGTFVNGMQLTTPHTLANGDVVGLGDTVTLTFYGPPVSAEETVVARPGMVFPAPPPTAPPPQAAPSPQPAPPPQPSFAPSYAPPEGPPPPEPKKRRTGLWIGCGCGTIIGLIILVIIALVVLDYLTLLPPVFYEPLRWFGF